MSIHLSTAARYIWGRAGQAALQIIGVVTIVFFTLRIAGDPARLLVPPQATPEDVSRIRQQLGLDTPVWHQYFVYLSGLLRFDLGNSYVQGRGVTDVLLERLPYTAVLAISALTIALLIGIPLGITTGYYRRRVFGRALMGLVLVGQSMPPFWLGILLILIFSVHLGLLPASGFEGAQSIILPAITLAALSTATIARITRSSFLIQLNAPYVLAARARGAQTSRVLLQHVPRNAALPILTLTALEAANLLGGAVITETIFAWPGVGQLTIESVRAQDYPMIQGIVLLGAVIYVLINLATDLMYPVIDPRIRLSRS